MAGSMCGHQHIACGGGGARILSYDGLRKYGKTFVFCHRLFLDLAALAKKWAPASCCPNKKNKSLLLLHFGFFSPNCVNPSVSCHLCTTDFDTRRVTEKSQNKPLFQVLCCCEFCNFPNFDSTVLG